MQQSSASSLTDVPREILDPAALLERMDGDEELVVELVGLFVDDCPNLLEETRAAVSGRDADALSAVAHTFKGSVSNFCARAASRAALELEMMGRGGAERLHSPEQWHEAEAALVVLESEIERLLPALNAFAAELQG